MKRAMASAFVIGLLCLASTGSAAVVLIGSTPATATNTYSTPAQTISLGEYQDYLGYSAVKNNLAPSVAVAGTRFGALKNASGNTGTFTFLSGGNATAGGPAFNRGASGTYQGGAYNNAETYNAAAGATDGVSVAYTLDGNTTATLNFYIGTNNALFQYSLSADGLSPALASLGTTGLTGGANTVESQAGTGNNSGLLSFTVANQSATPSVLTFKLLYAGPTAGTGNAVALQAATAVVPEPATLGLLGLSAITCLRRRRA